MRMSPIKQQVIDLVKALPDDCTLEDVQYHLSVREKVAKGMQAIRQGRVVPQEQAEKRVKAWSSHLDGAYANDHERRAEGGP